MTTADERLRALTWLPDAAQRVVTAASVALARDANNATVPVGLLRDLRAALRHYPSRAEIDLHWREDGR